MTTRAGAASLALRAKQEIVRILHGSGHHHSSFSFRDLKRAFLQRAHEIHPDKQQQQQTTMRTMTKASCEEELGDDDDTASKKSRATAEFIQLKEAWIRYEKTSKIPARLHRPKGSDDDVSRGGPAQWQQEEGNFTMFGVGCSFSDNDSERQKRTKIMDEASRGWFSAGEISHGPESDRTVLGNSGDSTSKRTTSVTSLASDDLFEMPPERAGNDNNSGGTGTGTCGTKRVPSLVSHLLAKPKR
jgi:cytochrome c556